MEEKETETENKIETHTKETREILSKMKELERKVDKILKP